MLEKTKVITLSKLLEDKTQKTAWEQIELREPVLLEVEQFYDKEAKASPLAAMRLLVSLVSGVPESVLGRMAFTDYQECEEYLLGFFDAQEIDGWRELAADVTFYFHWEPNAAWGMSLTRLEWWATQARRIKNLKANKNG